MDFIQTQKGRLFYKGRQIRLRGFGIGTWLCFEHFMMGFPTSEKMIRSVFTKTYGKETADLFFKIYQDTFLQEDDFKILKECGVNFIRIPFNYRLFIDDDDQPEIIRGYGFALFDRVFELCAKYEIFAVIDLHAAPGSQNPDWHSDNSNGAPLFWEYKVFRNQTVNLWGKIAARYADETYLMGYDVLNEPAMANWKTLNEFYEETIAAIRAVDKNHIIVLEGDRFSMDFSGLEHFTDDKLAIGFHYYPTVWRPDLLEPSMDRRTRKENIAVGLDRILDETNRFGWPVFCGEFGYAARDCGDSELAMQLLEDSLDLLEERNLDWLVWSYKDAAYMGMAAPDDKSGWMRLTNTIKTNWTQQIEKTEAAEILDLIAARWFPLLSDDERYILQFRLRACLYLLQGQYILEPALKEIGKEEIIKIASDFEIANCRVNDKMKNILKKRLKNN